jgi:hypothetical protein
MHYLGSTGQKPNLHIGGIKMRERAKAHKALRVVQSNKYNDAKFSDNEERSSKGYLKRKSNRKVIKAGSLVRKNVNPYNQGRNVQPSLDEDFSNSYIEGKSFVKNNKKSGMADKHLNRDLVPGTTESDILNSQKNIRDLEKNSKLLDLQNKLLSSASIGPYKISKNDNPNSTTKSTEKEGEEYEKKTKQQQYVLDLEEQIRLRDKIKKEEEKKIIQKRGTIDKFREDEFNVTPQWSNLNYNKTLKSHIDNDENPLNSNPMSNFSKNTNEVQLSPSKDTSGAMDRKGLGSAPKAVGAVIMRSDEVPISTNPNDPFGGHIPTRKKVTNRIDQELESRGSIFSGRDERSILVRKRNLQQQHMREELLRQIEEKKSRENDIKKKRMEEEMKEEKRIELELHKLNSNDEANPEETTTKRFSEKMQRENLAGNNAVFPELSNRASEPIKNQPPMVKNQPEESIYNVHKSPGKLETTAAFAASNQVINTFGGDAEEDEELGRANQESIKNAGTSESNKIKDMINQVDNKKSLQDQISKRMDHNNNQNAQESTMNTGPVVANPEIGELSDIVKKLLDEQRELKTKLNQRDNIIADLSSKEKTTMRKNTQERERRTRSLKPPTNSKKVGSADNKSLAARRLREKHIQDKERIDAIENKIQKARRRKADIKEVIPKSGKVKSIDRPNFKSRPNSDFDPKLKRINHHSNNDLDVISNTHMKSNLDDLNVCKARAIESPGYTISSKIDELNTQSRSKRSNYEYANDAKAGVSAKLADKYSNFKVPYDDLGLDDDIQEDQAFMFSLPPDDDDNYSSYSLLGGQVKPRQPMTEFDMGASEGGDQIDLLMNAYSRSNVRPIEKSEFTTSAGINQSPNYNDFYVVNKDENASGFYQSGNFPTPPKNQNNSSQNQQYDQFYASGGHPNFGIASSGYPNNQYHVTSSESQYRARPMGSGTVAGAQMMTNNGKLIMSPGNRVSSNIVFMPGGQIPNINQNNR